MDIQILLFSILQVKETGFQCSTMTFRSYSLVQYELRQIIRIVLFLVYCAAYSQVEYRRSPKSSSPAGQIIRTATILGISITRLQSLFVIKVLLFAYFGPEMPATVSQGSPEW